MLSVIDNHDVIFLDGVSPSSPFIVINKEKPDKLRGFFRPDVVKNQSEPAWFLIKNKF